MKTLLLMRHAKSDWNAGYDADHERPLNDRGIHSARLMGRVLSGSECVPDLVITSTAVRARSTASLANDAGAWRSDITLDPNLYGTGPERAVQVAAEAPDVGNLMLVGHQPTWSTLVSLITESRVEMKTATVAVIELDIARWTELTAARGEVAAVYQPRDYVGGEFDHQG
jgi:phosphohistidine phosphatase